MPPADPAAPQVPEPDGMLAYAMAIQNPSRDDPTWPLPSFDARDWAEAFCATAKKQGHDIDEDWMVTWFANALMRGYDEARMRQAKEVPHAREWLAEKVPAKEMPSGFSYDRREVEIWNSCRAAMLRELGGEG